MSDVTVGGLDWRRSNLGHLLFATTGLFVAQIVRAASENAGVAVTEAQLGLFAAIDPGGMRLTELAARSGVAKQSMIELIDRGVSALLLTRDPDPTDKRAKFVRLTGKGERVQAVVRRRSVMAADAMADAIGAKRVVAVRRALVCYLGTKRQPAAIDQLLARAARRFVRDVLADVHRHGYREVTEALLSLFRHLDLDGSRLTDLADRARITKQSMGGLVTRAAAMGLVERSPAPGDRRASLIRFTSSGLVMLEAFRVGVNVAEKRFVALTDANLAGLKAALADVLAADYRTAPAVARGCDKTPNSPG